MLHNKDLNEITRADLDALVANQVSEGRGLDYKRDLAFSKDADKKELARDIAAFANAAGGDLIFGIEEAKDSDGKNLGTPSQLIGVAENFDATKLVIETSSRARSSLGSRVFSSPRLTASIVGLSF